MAIDWRAFRDTVERKLGLKYRPRPPEAPPEAPVDEIDPVPATVVTEPAPMVAAADPVRLADGSPAKIGKRLVLGAGAIGTPRLGAILLAIEVDQQGDRWLVLGIPTPLPPLAGYHWVCCPNVDPAHCFSGIPGGLEPIPSEDVAGLVGPPLPAF